MAVRKRKFWMYFFITDIFRASSGSSTRRTFKSHVGEWEDAPYSCGGMNGLAAAHLKIPQNGV